MRSYSSLYFPAFGLNTEKYGVSLRIQSGREKMRNRITSNSDIFYAVYISIIVLQYKRESNGNNSSAAKFLGSKIS